MLKISEKYSTSVDVFVNIQHQEESYHSMLNRS